MPGKAIESTWPDKSNEATKSLSGTSQSSAIAAAVVLYLKALQNLPTAEETRKALMKLATRNIVGDPKAHRICSSIMEVESSWSRPYLAGRDTKRTATFGIYNTFLHVLDLWIRCPSDMRRTSWLHKEAETLTVI